MHRPYAMIARDPRSTFVDGHSPIFNSAFSPIRFFAFSLTRSLAYS
jgi:hypothetical protein